MTIPKRFLDEAEKMLPSWDKDFSTAYAVEDRGIKTGIEACIPILARLLQRIEEQEEMIGALHADSEIDELQAELARMKELWNNARQVALRAEQELAKVKKEKRDHIIVLGDRIAKLRGLLDEGRLKEIVFNFDFKKYFFEAGEKIRLDKPNFTINLAKAIRQGIGEV